MHWWCDGGGLKGIQVSEKVKSDEESQRCGKYIRKRDPSDTTTLIQGQGRCKQRPRPGRAQTQRAGQATAGGRGTAKTGRTAPPHARPVTTATKRSASQRHCKG